MIALDEAKQLVLRGAHFAQAEELLADADVEEFRHWFCRVADWPTIAEARRPKHWTGDDCPTCGGQMAWRGTCRQCTVCAEGGSCG